MSPENSYNNRDPRNYINDGEPRALYWAPYRETYERLKEYLEPGRYAPDNLPIMLVGKNCLTPFYFDIKNKDRVSLYDFYAPGVSGQLSFTNNLHIACGAIFDRDSRRQDHLYVVPRVDLFEEINYHVVYLPTPSQPLHVRIVHQNHIDNPETHLPPFYDRTKLAELFSKYKIC